MGQLEKYGLYVLCLVIFLILGVAIWGGDPATVTQASGKELSKIAAQPGKDPVKEPAKETPKSDTKSLEGFFAQAPKGGDEKKGASPTSTPGAGNEKVTDKKDEAKGKTIEPMMREHLVLSGERLEDIALKELGSRNRWHEIVAANSGLEPTRLRVNKSIKIPARDATVVAKAPIVDPKEALHGPKPEHAKKDSIQPLATVKTYKVKKGDTLTQISRHVYGDDKHVKAILAANQKKLANKNVLHENTILDLPAKS